MEDLLFAEGCVAVGGDGGSGVEEGNDVAEEIVDGGGDGVIDFEGDGGTDFSAVADPKDAELVNA